MTPDSDKPFLIHQNPPEPVSALQPALSDDGNSGQAWSEDSPPRAEVSQAQSWPTPDAPLRPVIAQSCPDSRVELIDDGNAGGIGIKITFDDPMRVPSEELKDILTAEDATVTGFMYQSLTKQWRQYIGLTTNPTTAAIIRADAERRFDAICEQLRHEEGVRDRNTTSRQFFPS